MNNVCLYHHGIKGMKWGVRRTDAQLGHKPKNSISNMVDKRRTALTDSYIAKGFADKDAAYLANKRLKAEAFVAAIGIATVATVGANYASDTVMEYKRKKNYDKDGSIAAGTKIQRMADTHNQALDNRGMYVTTDKKDSKLFYNIWGTTHKMNLEAMGELKIPSKKKAEEAFFELLDSDSDFKRAVDTNLLDFKESYSKKDYRLGKAMATYEKNKNYADLDDKGKRYLYDSFNIFLATENAKGSGAARAYYDNLTNKGYDAVMDYHDIDYSYKRMVKAPTIIFNPAATLKLNSLDEITKTKTQDLYGQLLVRGTNMKRQTNAITARNVAVKTAKTAKNMATTKVGHVAIGAIAVKALTVKQVNDYRKKHPNSGLTDKEIREMIVEEQNQKR